MSTPTIQVGSLVKCFCHESKRDCVGLVLEMSTGSYKSSFRTDRHGICTVRFPDDQIPTNWAIVDPWQRAPNSSQLKIHEFALDVVDEKG